MSEIDLITEQIIALQPVLEQHKIEVTILFVSFFIGGIAGGVLSLTGGENLRIVGFAILSIGVVTGVMLFSSLYGENNPVYERDYLMDLRSNLTKAEIRNYSCEELRLDILNKLESDDIPEWIMDHNKFEKDLYYHKCEIPLREEVMKLGEQ